MLRGEVIHGFKAFTAHLQKNLGRYHQSPILLIESHPLLDGHGKLRESKQVADACRRVRFLFSQQLGLRTVSFHSSSDYAFPLASTGPDAAIQMAKRTGANTVVAVGSGQALDLAKTVSKEFDTTILVPASYGAVMVAGTSHALLLDQEAETLVPEPFDCNDELLVVTPDIAFTQQETRDTAILAAVSILLDAMLQKQDAKASEELMKHLVDNLRQVNLDTTGHELLCQRLLRAGTLASFGLDKHDRSIPVALVASLLTSTFTETDSLVLMASAVPSLHRMLSERNMNYADASILDEKLLQSAPKVITAEPFNTLLAQIHENQTLWNCFDARDAVLQDALKDHLLV